MNRMMKRTVMHMMLLAITMTVNAQSIEPNLKWGKPTDQELNMTEYAADKDADAVVLYKMLVGVKGEIDSIIGNHQPF